MKTLSQIQIEAYKLYKSLEVGRFFDAYHDMMLDLVEQIGYLEHDNDGDLKLGLEYLEQCKAIHKAQQVLIKAKIK
jgi:hypothetical protein